MHRRNEARIPGRFSRQIAAIFARHVHIEKHDFGLELDRGGKSAGRLIHNQHFIFARALKDHAREPRKV